MSASIWPCSRPFHPFTEPPPKSRYSVPFFGCFITKAEGIHAAHHIVHGYQIDFQAISSHTCICGPRCSCSQLVLVRHLCGCVSVHVCMRVCTSSINFCIVTFFFLTGFLQPSVGYVGNTPVDWLVSFRFNCFMCASEWEWMCLLNKVMTMVTSMAAGLGLAIQYYSFTIGKLKKLLFPRDMRIKTSVTKKL